VIRRSATQIAEAGLFASPHPALFPRVSRIRDSALKFPAVASVYYCAGCIEMALPSLDGGVFIRLSARGRG